MLDAGVEFFAEAFGVEVPEDDPAEDGRHGGAGEQVDVQSVEVSDEATCGKVLRKCFAALKARHPFAPRDEWSKENSKSIYRPSRK